MIGKVRLASPGLLAGMTAVWLAGLLGIDVIYNPHLWDPENAVEVQPQDRPFSIRLNRLCCTACFADARRALQSIPWLAGSEPRPRAELPTIEEATSRLRHTEYAGWLDLEAPAIQRMDFVELDRALRAEALVASQMVVRGVEHVRLIAEFKHPCSGACKSTIGRIARAGASAGPGLSFGAGSLQPLHWIDSVAVEPGQRRVTVYPRYQDPEQGLDVGELLAAFRQLGLEPLSLRVEQETNPGPAARGHEVSPRLARSLE